MAQRLSLNFLRWSGLVILLIIGLSMFEVRSQNSTGTNSTTTNTTTNTTNTTSNTTNSTSSTNSTSNTTTGANTTNTSTSTGTTSSLVFSTIKATATVITLNASYASYIVKAGATSYFYADAPSPAATTPLKIVVFPSQVTGVSAFSSMSAQAAFQDRTTATTSTGGVAMTTESSTLGQTSFTASAKDGYYMLALKNGGSTDQTVTVKIAQTSNYYLAPYYAVQAYHANTDPALRTFETYINNSGSSYRTYYELDSCVGNSLLYVSSADPSTFPTNTTTRLQYNIALKRTEINVATGTYYIYVQPVEFPYSTGGVNYATYQLNAKTIFANETMAQTYYRPGNNGQVYFKVNDGAGVSLNVNWTPFVLLTTSYTYASGTSTSYSVIASKTKAKVTSYVNCGAIVLPSSAPTTDSTLTANQDITANVTASTAQINLQSNTGYYVGVYGTISGFSSSSVAPSPQNMPYGVFYYQSPPPGDSGSSTDGAVAALIAIDVILFVVCIILGAIIYKMFYSKSATEASNAGGNFAAQGGNSASASSSKNKYRV